MSSPRPDANSADVSPEDGSVANVDKENNPTAEPTIANGDLTSVDFYSVNSGEYSAHSSPSGTAVANVGPDANSPEVSPENGLVASVDNENNATAESAVASVVATDAAAADEWMFVGTAEESAARSLSSTASADLLTGGDMTAVDFYSINIGDYSAHSSSSGDQSMLSTDHNGSAATQPPPELDDTSCLFVVQCSSEKDAWAHATCLIAFVSAFIGDGVFISLFLFDSRVGTVDKVPPGTRTLEHMAVYALFFYAVQPFACVLVNRHGFRPLLFSGSLLTIAWSACLWSVFEVLVDNRGLLLAVVGGTGAGLIRTSFTILLSLLYNLSRHKVHLFVHLGGFSGIMIVASYTEYTIVYVDWKAALIINMMLTVSTFVFWILVATPVPQKIEVADNGSKVFVKHPMQTKSVAVAKNAQTLVKNHQFPTVWNTVGNRQLCIVPFTIDTPVLNRTDTLSSIGLDRLKTLYMVREPEIYCRHWKGFFGPTLVGSRPMYRDDVLFTGNVFHLLDENLKDIEYLYPLLMTRIMTVSDVKDELNGWNKMIPMSVSRTFHCIMSPEIWGNIPFILYAVSEFSVHAAHFIPLMFIKGPPDMMKTSSETVIMLVAGCCGLLAGRGLGFLLHETTATAVPIYSVGIVLIANGLSLFLSTTTDIAGILPYFAIYGLFFGYYNSMQNALVYNVFPVHRINTVFGQTSLVRALGSCIGILIAVRIQEGCRQSSKNVYTFAGLLMTAAGVFVGLLQAAVNSMTMAHSQSSSTYHWDFVYPTNVTKVTACPPILIT